MKFVRVEYDNNRVAGAELTSHREVIEEYALKGYKYLGFVPVKLGPSGKMLALDLVFDNKQCSVCNNAMITMKNGPHGLEPCEPFFFEALGFYKSSIQPILFEFTVFSITEFLSMRAI